ncbi:MAG TPA: Rieske (2Fe-2S) protein [Propionibacteriaceae bacterium]
MRDRDLEAGSYDDIGPVRAARALESTMGATELTRRTVLRTAGVAAVAVGGVGALAACGAGTKATTPSRAPGGSASPGGSGAGAGSLAKVDAIPVGGAILVTDSGGKPIILAQPTAGTVVGMSAICTHLGCTVAPAGAQLVCPCHGSVYKAADGSNVSGPAPSPLPAVAVHVQNGEVLPG